MAKWNKYQSGSGDRKQNQQTAKDIFSLQAQHHQFPDKVMAAARKIRQYIATPADIALIRQTLGDDSVVDVQAGTQTKIVGEKNQAIYKKWRQQNRKAGEPTQGAATSSAANSGQRYGAPQIAGASAQAAASKESQRYASATPTANSSPAPAVASNAAMSTSQAESVLKSQPSPTGGQVNLLAAVKTVISKQIPVELGKYNKKHQSIARSVIEKNALTGTTSQFLLDAAQRVRSLTYSAADVELLNEHNKIQQAEKKKREEAAAPPKDATAAFMKQARGIQFYAGKVGRYAANAGRMIDGDPFQAARAGVETIQDVSRDVARLSRSKAGKALANAAGEMLGAEAGAGAKALGKVAGTLGKLNAYLQVAQLVAEAVYTGTRMGEDALGIEASDRARIDKSDIALMKADGTRTHPLDRRLAELRRERDRIYAQTENTPKVGGLIARLRAGDGYEINRLDSMQSQRNAGLFGDVEKSRDLARSRLFREKYGATFGALAEKGYDAKVAVMGHDVDLEKEVDAKKRESDQRVADLKQTMYERIADGDIDAAKAYQNEARAEQGSDTAWRDPGKIFVEMDQARGAARSFPLTQSMRRLRSYE